MTHVWTRGQVMIALSKGDRVPVDADIMNGLAVSQSIDMEMADGRPCFSISHVATGRAACRGFRFGSQADARVCAEALAHLPVIWTETDSPSFRKPWLMEAIETICALCDGFLVESPLDGPAGGHA